MLTYICCRKDKPIGQALNQSFSLGEALDAVADVYNGVSYTNKTVRIAETDHRVVCFLVHVDIIGSARLV
jgi:hypothetical protein